MTDSSKILAGVRRAPVAKTLVHLTMDTVSIHNIIHRT